MTRVLSAFVALMLLAGPAAAHKVIASAYVIAGVVEGEIGFSNGDMAVGQAVQVRDTQGAVVATVVTDADGFFTFIPTQTGTFEFRADMGAGHVALTSVTVDSVKGDRPAQTTTPPDIVPTRMAPPVALCGAGCAPSQPAGLTEDQVSNLLREHLRPLRQEMTQLKEQRGLQDILGGIGYIAGIFGFGFYLAAKRELQKDAE